MGQFVLPFYLVCDESGSMMGDPANAINDSLPDLLQEIGGNPAVADKTRFCMIGFTDLPELLLPLSDLSQVTSIPGVTARGGTAFAPAFTFLRQTIEADVAALRQQGNEVYRPTVFFFSDGQPADTWQPAYRQLVDPGWGYHPNILAFGFGTADSLVIQQIATVLAFIADGTLSPAGALREFAQSLIKSIVASGSKTSSKSVNMQMPDHVPGYITMSAEVV
jgi:uncharacterized protein YegL